MPTRKSSLYDKKQKYVTMDYCSEYLHEGMLERLDGWSEYEEFQIGCYELIKVFSAWETSKVIREKPEEWSFLKKNERFQNRKSEDLERSKNAFKKLNTLMSQLNAETEKNWEAIERDGYFTNKEKWGHFTKGEN